MDVDVPMEKTKACTKCGETKPLSDFSKHRLSKDGHAYQCKACNAKRSKIWRKTPVGIYTLIKGREGFYKQKPFNLIKEEFVEWYNSQLKQCVYCDIPEEYLYLLQEHYGDITDRLTIDCKDNKTGYQLDNLVLSCNKCNITKNNVLTFDEMMYVGQNFIKPKWQAFLEEP